MHLPHRRAFFVRACVAVVASEGVTEAMRACSAAPLSTAAFASIHCAALLRALRPHSSRSFSVPLSAPRSAAFRALFHRVARCVQSAAAHALVDGASLGALRSPLLHSESPALHLGLRRDCARSVQEGPVCRNRLGRRGFGGRTGRACHGRKGRVA